MPISLNKFENFIESKGMIIKKIFTISGEIVYIETFNINNSEIVHIYIPSKYVMKTDNRPNIYKLKYIEISEDDNDLIKKEKRDIEDQYNQIDIDDDDDIVKDNKELEKNMIDNYNKQITLESLKKEDKDNIKDIMYQLSRLKLCVQNIKYKLTILYKNYLCSIKRDNTIECYVIKHFPKSNELRIYVSTDLENLYININNISNDVKKIKNGIYKVMNKNQIKHNAILIDLLQKKDKLALYSDNITKKKSELDQYILQLEELLKKININQAETYNKINSIKDKYLQDSSTKGFHNDVQMTHEISIEQKKLENINSAKEEILKNIINLRIKQEHLTLMIDKILFDKSVMLNTIILNLNNLSNLISDNK